MGFPTTLDKRRIATVIVVLLIAFLTGHAMQSVLTGGNPVAAITDGPDAAPTLRRGNEPKPLPTPPAATLMPILEPPPVLPRRVQEPLRIWRDAKTDAASCASSITTRPAAAAMVVVDVLAPCLANAPVLLSQGPVTIRAHVDTTGKLSIRFPALTRRATFKAAIDGKTLVSTVEVPGAESFRHVILMWTGPQILGMHAYEFGALKNQFGHVWSGAPKSPVRASRGSGGFLTRLGNGTGASTEIYSFPAGQSPTNGVVRLVVEGKVTQENCGQQLRATSLQSGVLDHLSATEVEFQMPGCDKLGQTVRLQNLLQDMRLAAR